MAKVRIIDSTRIAKTFRELFAERLEKYNHNHGPDGRFTSGSSMSIDGKGGGGGYGQQDKPYGEAQTNAEQRKAVKRSTEEVRSKCTTDAPSPVKREPFNPESVTKECNCTREKAEEAHTFAKDIFEQAVADEPKITQNLIDVAKANGGQMYGLDFRLKQETSLARKIINDANDEYGGDLSKAAGKIKDAVRYTMVFDDNGFTKSYKDTKSTLEAAGYEEMRCKNFWDKYSKDTGNPIKSVQSVFRSPDGTLFELQFQTYNSQGAKEISHPMYEKQRSKDTSKDEKKSLGKQMRHLYSHVKNPPYVKTIESHSEF